MQRNPDQRLSAAALRGLLFLALLLLATACGDGTQAPYIPGDEDENAQDGDQDSDPWNPGDYDPDTACNGEGEGDEECGGNPTDTLDCTTGPCIFGQCVARAGGGFCQCDAGYAGTYCEHCAEGFSPQGLRCVQTGGACQDLCLYGACHILNEQPICDCQDGYAGDRCDHCADGYHEENLRCVAN